jgi:hypothetical protein
MGLLFHRLIVLATLVPGIVPVSYAESPRVLIVGMRSSYKPSSVVKALLRNASTHRIEVNVAVERLVENHWEEVFASITDPKHPYGKTVRLMPVESGAFLHVSFKPVEKAFGVSQLAHSSLPLSLRLRVDIYDPHGGRIVDRVRSTVFCVSTASC